MTAFTPPSSERPHTTLATDSALRAVQQSRPASAHTMTIEELATQVGMTVRNVRAYNTRCATFPSNLVAAIFGFRPADFFELRDPSAREAPRMA